MNLTSLRRVPAVRTVVRRLGVHRVVAVVGLLRLPVSALLRVLISPLPRDPRLVVFGSPLDRFADNSAYLFVHMAHAEMPERVVWISGSPEVVAHLRSHGLSAERRWSLRGVRACLRAGAFVTSGYRTDINGLLSPGALCVSLWHGVGIKKVGLSLLDNEVPRRPGLLKRLALLGGEPPPDAFLTTSEFSTEKIFSPSFDVPVERCWEFGYPRNDHLFRGDDPPSALVQHRPEWAELATEGRVVGVFLTWRDHQADDAIDASLLREIAAVATRHGARVAYKPHYNVAAAEVPTERCTAIPSQADLHAFLGLCDVLVTDYSSIAADFALMKRPAVYFMPDLDEYIASRGFYFDPERQPGVIAHTQAELLNRLDAALRGNEEPWSDDDDAYLRFIWGGYSGSACQQVARALSEALGN